MCIEPTLLGLTLCLCHLLDTWSCINFLESLNLLFKVGELWYPWKDFETIKWNITKIKMLSGTVAKMLFKIFILSIILIIFIIITVFLLILSVHCAVMPSQLFFPYSSFGKNTLTFSLSYSYLKILSLSMWAPLLDMSYFSSILKHFIQKTFLMTCFSSYFCSIDIFNIAYGIFQIQKAIKNNKMNTCIPLPNKTNITSVHQDILQQRTWEKTSHRLGKDIHNTSNHLKLSPYPTWLRLPYTIQDTQLNLDFR